jgi:hypothetical protein
VRLSEENARRLTRLVWRDRLLRALPIVVAVAVLAAGFTFLFLERIERADLTVDVTMHDGTVLGVKKLAAARGAAIVHVHLDDGRDVDAFSALRLVPIAGAHVQISEARHASGKLTYDVTGLGD